MIRASIAFLASLLTGAQAVLLYSKKSSICFNDGCAVVDSLTRVDPIYFNLAGFLFFQGLFWLSFLGYRGVEYGHKLARIILLGGMAAEGVLIFFQYSIAKVFCSYCLIVFSCILLLNLLSGFRQILRSLVVFAGVLVACFSLSFNSVPKGDASLGLDGGSVAVMEGSSGVVGSSTEKQYLFFSSTCPHCEKVLAELRRENSCQIRFNPIEKLDDFSFPGAVLQQGYDPQENLQLLKRLGIDEIPVLLKKGSTRTEIYRGEEQIGAYLQENCRTSQKEEYSGSSKVKPQDFLYELPKENDGCRIDEDCSDQPAAK